jgi:hypothetical protein
VARVSFAHGCLSCVDGVSDGYTNAFSSGRGKANVHVTVLGFGVAVRAPELPLGRTVVT